MSQKQKFYNDKFLYCVPSFQIWIYNTPIIRTFISIFMLVINFKVYHINLQNQFYRKKRKSPCKQLSIRTFGSLLKKYSRVYKLICVPWGLRDPSNYLVRDRSLPQGESDHRKEKEKFRVDLSRLTTPILSTTEGNLFQPVYLLRWSY